MMIKTKKKISRKIINTIKIKKVTNKIQMSLNLINNEEEHNT
jgi:hypothetical protein